MIKHEGDRLRPARPSRGDEKLAQLLGAISDLNDSLQQLHAGVKTSNAIRRVGAESRPILNGASTSISRNLGRVAGYSIRETTGAAAAVVRIRDGFDATGDLLLTIALPAAGSAVEWFMPGGIAFTVGCFLEVVSGAVEGAVHLGTSL